jgi:hypothetical protein
MLNLDALRVRDLPRVIALVAATLVAVMLALALTVVLARASMPDARHVMTCDGADCHESVAITQVPPSPIPSPTPIPIPTPIPPTPPPLDAGPQ